MKHQTCRLNGIVTGAALIAALWIPNWCSAQSRNREFIHSPAVSPAPVTLGTLHPAPPAFSQPKHPWTKPVDRGPLPQINPRGVYRENPDNLIRMWRSQRPMKERQQAVKQSLAGRAQVDQLDRTSPRRNSLVQAALSELATTAAWSQIGSGNWVSPTLPNRLNTGRIRQAAYAYDNSQGATTLWVGATGGGLWRAVPGGPADVTFVSVSDNLPGSPSVGAFLVQPGNSNNILIGSGDAYRYGGTGLYKTTNAGATWYPVEPSDGTSWPGTFQKILIDVSDPTNQTVLAQGNSGIWRSTDFGDHWNQVYAGPASDLVQDPVHPWQWYAGVFYLGVLRSTDYGCSFIPVASGITGPIGRTAVALSPAAPWHVYAMTAALVDGISRSLGGIWRSDDYGETWTAIETTDLISGFGQAFHTTSLNVDPNNPDIVFAGMAEMQVTYNATASAPTWNYSLFGNDIIDEGHADHTGFVFEPGTRNVISTTDGGVYVLDEDTLRASGTLNYNTGLNLQQVFGPVVDLACSLTAPDLCISGLQDNGVVTFNRNNDPVIVDPLNGVDGGSVSISPDGSSELFAMINGGRLYTTDSGASWDFFGNCFPNNYYATTMIDQTPARLAPNIYTFSGNFVYYKGVNPYCDWGAASSAPLPVEFSPRSMDVSNDPNGNVFYTVGWSTGTLYVMDSYSDGPLGSMTFEDRTPPLPSGSGFYDSQIAADRSSLRPYTVTYTTGISRPSRAYLSNDRGQHWTDVTGDLAFTLTDASYWKLVANPSDQTQLFLGTDVGIFRSDNGGANWYRYSDGMPAVASICGLELNFDQANPPLLHLGTYGRGFWDRQVAPDAAIQSVTLKRGPAVGGRRIQGEVQLNKAVAADITVLLSSTEPSFASVPATVTVPVGQQSAKFVVQTYPVKDSSPVGVLASHNGLERAAYFTVLPRGRK